MHCFFVYMQYLYVSLLVLHRIWYIYYLSLYIHLFIYLYNINLCIYIIMYLSMKVLNAGPRPCAFGNYFHDLIFIYLYLYWSLILALMQFKFSKVYKIISLLKSSTLHLWEDLVDPISKLLIKNYFTFFLYIYLFI